MLIFVILLFGAFFVVSGIFLSLEAKQRNGGGLRREPEPESAKGRRRRLVAIGRSAIPNRN